MNEVLQRVIDNLDVMRELSDREVYLSVMDKEGIVLAYSVPQGVTPKLDIGKRFIDPTGVLNEVIRTGVKKHNILSEEVMGVALEGNLVPIMDGKEVIGCISSSYIITRKSEMKELVKRFHSSVSEVSESVQNILDGMKSLSDMLGEMNEMTSGIEGDVSTATQIVGHVGKNASRSNILALNASIEAARSGEAGRGFSVVAKEMGILANESSTSATQIKAALDGIVKHLKEIVLSIKGASDEAESHAKAIDTINEILNESIELAEKLENGFDEM